MMRIEPDFVDLLQLLNEHKVRYCIVGSFAVAFHPRPRYTKDMDILIEPEQSNAKKILLALNDFGFGSLNLKAEDFIKEDMIIQLGFEPVCIDLITSLPGLTFTEIWRHHIQGKYGNAMTNFIGLTQLIKAKQTANRKQDQADLELLLRIKPV